MKRKDDENVHERFKEGSPTLIDLKVGFYDEEEVSPDAYTRQVEGGCNQDALSVRKGQEPDFQNETHEDHHHPWNHQPRFVLRKFKSTCPVSAQVHEQLHIKLSSK